MPEKTTKGQAGLLKRIRANIAWIAKTGQSVESRIQETAKMCLRYMSQYHDKRPMLEFVGTIQTALPGYAVNQLIAYMGRHSPLQFEYDATKRNVTDISEKRDDKGNLSKAYSPDDVLDKAPFIMEPQVREQNTRPVEPWSLKLYLDRVGSIRTQIEKAGEPGNRGILGVINGKPTALHKGDKGFDEAYARLINAVTTHQKDFENIMSLVQAGTPAAEVAANREGRTTVIKGRAKTPATATGSATPATGKTATKAAA